MYFYEKKNKKTPETLSLLYGSSFLPKENKREVVGEVIIFNHLQVKVAIPM